jgi:hypothetical protein
MLRGMAGRGGLGAPSELSYVAQQLVSVFSLFGFKIEGRWLTLLGVFGRAGMVGILLAAVAFLPNSQQMLAGLRPALQKVMPSRLGRWLGHMLVSRPFLEPDGSLRLTALTGFIFAGLFLAALAWQTMRTTSLQPFIYFQF